MKTILKAVLAVTAMVASVPAAASVTFDTTTGGSYTGNSAGYSFTSGGITMTATAWQAAQGTNLVNSAQMGLYSPGMGVIGIGDNGGANNYHQFDNAVRYTDFALLTFSQAVTIDSFYLNAFAIPNVNPMDTDLSFTALTGPAVALAGSTITPANWTTVLGGPSAHSAVTGSGAASTRWLVGAGVADNLNNDAFKIASVTVHAAVPEPATWAMMLIGFGAAGVSLRRRRQVGVMQAA